MSITARSITKLRGQVPAKLVSGAPAAAGTFTPDLNQGEKFTVTMPAGNITMAAPVNGRTGHRLEISIVQDATGSRLVTWNAVYKFAGAASPTLTTTASRKDTFVFRFNGTNWEEVSRTLNTN